MKTWFVTGGNRGLGLEIVRAALADGNNVVAGTRNIGCYPKLEGSNVEKLLITPLDVTDKASIALAVKTAESHFGRIDVLINNAGYGLLGPFEEHSEDAILHQFQTNVFGAFEMTRAVLPSMRTSRRGVIVNISSTAGVVGHEGASLYCASKFALTGWSEALALELKQFGIKVTSIHPGPFRTDFLDVRSVHFGNLSVPGYEEYSNAKRKAMETASYKQAGDPVKFAKALIQLVNLDDPPIRWAAGTDAYQTFLRRAENLRSSAEALKQISLATDINEGGVKS